MSKNLAVLFNAFPVGLPKVSDFVIEAREIPQLNDEGQIKVKLVFVSVDPYMRARMREGGSSYFSGFKLGFPLEGGCVAEVVESKSVDFSVGDQLVGLFPWVLYQVLTPALVPKLHKWTPIDKIPSSTAIGSLGMPGMTAYFGLLDITNPKEGETVVVSGAAGAVGSLVGQIAKIKGCRVIGIAGSDEKCQLMKDRYHFDEVLNYKTLNTFETMKAAIKDTCPKGVDIYFDNTGGYISDAVTLNMNDFGRISVCGSIDTYNATNIFEVQGPRLDWLLITKNLKKEGFLVFRWEKRYPEGIAQMAEWIKQGKLIFDETFVDGIENCPRAFIEMMTGKNIGKMVVRC